MIGALKITVEFAIKYKLNIFFAAIFTVIFTSCSRSEMQENTDKESFSQYMKFNSELQTVKFELVTLPEGGRDSIPGPTDYVSLVASAVTADSGETAILALPVYSGSTSVLQNFVRPWLTGDERSFLLGPSVGNGVPVRDVSSLVTKHAKRAMAIRTGKNHWLFYVEYVAP